jgi:hypothetical protein
MNELLNDEKSTNFPDIPPIKTMEEFFKLLDGKEQISGTNVNYIKSKISQYKSKKVLTSEENNDLYKCYTELGLDENGEKKRKTCWDYIHNDNCSHTHDNLKIGKNIGGRWHPDEDERNYLKSKVC